MEAACDKQHGGKTNTDAKHGNSLGSRFLKDRSLMDQKSRTAGRVFSRSAAERRRSEYLVGTFQRLQNAPGQPESDEGPEQRRTDIQPSLADAERAMLDRGLALRARRLQPGDLIG